MTTLLRCIALAATTLVATGTQALAVSQPTGSYTFRTDFTDARGYGAGAYEGVLNLRIATDGTVQGTYRAADGSRESIVTGGLTGTQMWLDIGARHINATFSGGKIEGYTQISGPGRDGVNDGYRFEAVPIAPQL